MSRNSRFLRFGAALAAAGVLATSGATRTARAQAPPQPGAAPAAAPGVVPAPAAPAPQAGQPGAGEVLVPGSGFRYDPTGRRDPFKSLLALEGKKRDVASLPPIQQFDLESVKVVGVVLDPVKGAQAMIRASSGQTFVVRKGMVIGKNEGEIVEISLMGIRVVEKYVDFMNRETRKETVLLSHPVAGK